MTKDLLDLLERSIDQTHEVLTGVSDDQLRLPTPCRSWDVGTLVGHLVHDTGQFTVTAEGGRADWSKPAPEVISDWAGRFRAGGDELIAAWRKAGDLDRVVEAPGLGELPLSFRVNLQIGEFAVHAWDLAKATGQSVNMDEDVARVALEWSRQTIRPEYRGTEAEGMAFGPEVPVADDAPIYDRLAAFSGRDPAWRPS